MSDAATQYLETTIAGLRATKKHAEDALAQLSDGDLNRLIDPDANSIALIMRHMAGNMRSRWVDFLTTDGEKATRDRDGEFDHPPQTRGEVTADWESGWRAVFSALEPLTAADLLRSVPIRGEPHTVIQAIDRQVRHYSEHVGQIVLLAKHWRGKQWSTLSIAKAPPRPQAAPSR